MVAGEAHAKEAKILQFVNGQHVGSEEGVDHSQRDTEGPHEAAGQVGPLNQHQGPVKQCVDALDQQQERDRKVHSQAWCRRCYGCSWLWQSELERHALKTAPHEPESHTSEGTCSV